MCQNQNKTNDIMFLFYFSLNLDIYKTELFQKCVFYQKNGNNIFKTALCSLLTDFNITSVYKLLGITGSLVSS